MSRIRLCFIAFCEKGPFLNLKKCSIINVLITDKTLSDSVSADWDLKPGPLFVYTGSIPHTDIKSISTTHTTTKSISMLTQKPSDLRPASQKPSRFRPPTQKPSRSITTLTTSRFRPAQSQFRSPAQNSQIRSQTKRSQIRPHKNQVSFDATTEIKSI